MISSTGRPLMPPARLMRSTASWVPTRAVLPPAAAAPDSGCMVPILYGLAWPNASRQGGGTSMVAPGAPAAAAKLGKRRRCDLRQTPVSRAAEVLGPGSALGVTLYAVPHDWPW